MARKLTFQALRDRHRGCFAVVVGQGPSAAELPQITNAVELVVNDGWRTRPAADYAVILDRPRQLLRKRRIAPILEGEGTTLIYDGSLPHWTRWALGTEGQREREWLSRVIAYPARRRLLSKELDDWREGVMPYYGGTPFVACSLAAWMGATTVGVIGVDMSDPERWSMDARREAAMRYRDLWQLLRRTGVELVSLSRRNACDGAIPRMELDGVR